MDIKSCFKDKKWWFMIIVLMEIHYTGSSSHMDNTYTRVVESSVLLICPTSVKDIETVRWTKNAIHMPILSYYPKDGNMLPEDHNKRLDIRNDTHLMISSLELADAGNYTCVIASVTLPSDERHVIQLHMQDGCTMPLLPDHLTSSNRQCIPGSYIDYKYECNFTCTYGFTTIGDMSTVCQANGRLSNGLPKCRESSCHISSTPDAPVKVEGCLNCSRILYGHNITFSCETGYILKGPGVVTCLNTGDLDSPYPTCEELEPGNETNLIPLLAIFVIPVVIASGAILFCMKRKGCTTHTKTGNDVEETVPLEDQHQTTKVTFKSDKGDHATKLSTCKSLPRHPKDQLQTTKVTFRSDKGDHATKPSPCNSLPRHLKKLFKQFRPTLISRLNPCRMPDILRRMHAIELNYILPRAPLFDEADELKEYVNKCVITEMSRKEAFALYITVLMSFIDDKETTRLAQLEIFALTGLQQVEDSCIKSNPNEHQHLLENKTNNDYIEIVLTTFTALIKTELSSIEDQKTKNERNSQMSNVTMRFINEHPVTPKMEDVSSHSRSTVQSLEETIEDDEFFAKLCEKSIRQFDKLDDSVMLRHFVLDALFGQS